MIIEKIQRVANPTRSKRKHKVKRNPKKRIKLSAKQIKAGFGGKRRKNAVRAKPRKTNPKKRKVYALRRKPKYVTKKRAHNPHKHRKVYAKRRVERNPSILTLGFVNPERKTMKTRKRRKTTAQRRTAAKNPTPRRRRYYARKANPTHRRRTRRHHRNPDFLGNGMEAVGVLLGVAAQKIVKGFIPSSIGGGNAMVSVAISFVTAFLIGKGADMVTKGKPVGKGIALGALAAAASDAVNVFAPQLSSYVGLNGLATYQNALFAVPENPIMRGLPAPSVPVAAKGMGGAMTAAFGHSF